MGKISYMRLKGSQNLRLRLLLSTLSTTPILIEDIRANATWPGLRPHEVSFLRLLEKVSDDCVIEINETGITNDSKDPSVDTFRSTTLPMLKQFGIPSEGLDLKIQCRGVPPHGGGEVILSIPIVQDSLKAITWIDEGMIKRIRGVTFSTKVSVQFENTMIHAARGHPVTEFHFFAETTSGCFISADTAVSYGRVDDEGELDDEKKELSPPGDIGEKIASALLSEIEQGGVVDSTHQGLLFLLCALCPQDVSKVRVGKLSPYGMEVLRHIRDFLGVKFVIKPDPSTETVILKCVGCGLKNLSRKVS
ncbi:hypothetical protein DH2020_025194 [Rehmannia glutinosa]|uniref:RNA 3'-terminal phosphate cyclase-like protein n=1 Tax=Rehmannia glutinosa TaxID=99300 RepID=A0ABR0W4A1_REHGL